MIEILSTILFNVVIFGLFALPYYFLNRAEHEPLTTSHKIGAQTVYWFIGISFLFLLLGGLLLHLSGFIFTNTSFHKFGISLSLPALTALLFFIPSVRKNIARLIPIDSTSRVHTITLTLSMLIIIQMAMTYAVGMKTLIELETDSNVWGLIAAIWSQDLMFVLIGFIGVGFLTKRSYPETLQRLGLSKPSYQQVAIGVTIALGLVVVITLLEYLLVQTGLEYDKNVQDYTEKLIGPLLTSIPGILTLGLAAAIGEETVFRGALQPRFGILLTSLLFALVHSNYGFSMSTLIVFGLGICLGFVRVRFNTTTAMIVHAIYNMSIGMLEFWQSP